MIGNISGCSCDLLRRCTHGSSVLIFLKQRASCVCLGLHSACIWMGGLAPSLQKLEVHRTRAGKLPNTHQKILQLWLLTTSPTIHASFIERGKLPRGHRPAGDKPAAQAGYVGDSVPVLLCLQGSRWPSGSLVNKAEVNSALNC